METKTTSQEYIQKQKQAKDIIIWKQKQQQVNDIIYMERKNKTKKRFPYIVCNNAILIKTEAKNRPPWRGI